MKKNYISILRKTPDGKKKGRRIQFTLGSLLQVVQQLRTALKLSSDDEKIEQVIEEMEAQMRSDASRRDIDRILLPKSRRKKSSKDDPDL